MFLGVGALGVLGAHDPSQYELSRGRGGARGGQFLPDLGGFEGGFERSSWWGSARPGARGLGGLVVSKGLLCRLLDRLGRGLFQMRSVQRSSNISSQDVEWYVYVLEEDDSGTCEWVQVPTTCATGESLCKRCGKTCDSFIGVYTRKQVLTKVPSAQ